MDKVRAINEKWAKKKRRKPTVGLGTFGCQMNEHDSEELAYMLERMGYEKTEQMHTCLKEWDTKKLNKYTKQT